MSAKPSTGGGDPFGSVKRSNLAPVPRVALNVKEGADACTVADPAAHVSEQALTPREVAIVEATAHRVVELLEERRDLGSSPRLVDAATLSSMLGVSRSTVYEHAEELGAVRLGRGSKPRLRFDPDRAKAAVSRSESGRSQPDFVSADGSIGAGERPRRRRLPNGLPKTGSVLAVRASRKVA